jgi:uncharacterized membrane protein YgcG
MSDLERELEQELHRVLDAVSGRPIPPRRTVHARVSARALLGGAGAALTVKLLTGVAVAAAAVTVAGAATTGSLNPTVWGQKVSETVESCKLQLANGQHGIGDCVSSFASQHGAAVASDARHHGNGSGNSNGNGNGSSSSNGSSSGSGNGHSKDKGNGHTAPAKTSSSVPPTIDPEPVDAVGGHPPVTISPGP